MDGVVGYINKTPKLPTLLDTKKNLLGISYLLVKVNRDTSVGSETTTDKLSLLSLLNTEKEIKNTLIR